MNDIDRRVDTRLNIRVPLRVRPLNRFGAPELYAESDNLSQRGIYFTTNIILEVGTPVEVVLRMPTALLGPVARDIRCIARVVHVQSDSTSDAKAGIGLHIEHYEAMELQPERWAS